MVPQVVSLKAFRHLHRALVVRRGRQRLMALRPVIDPPANAACVPAVDPGDLGTAPAALRPGDLLAGEERGGGRRPFRIRHRLYALPWSTHALDPIRGSSAANPSGPKRRCDGPVGGEHSPAPAAAVGRGHVLGIAVRRVRGAAVDSRCFVDFRCRHFSSISMKVSGAVPVLTTSCSAPAGRA